VDQLEAEKTRRGATRRGAAHYPAAAAFKEKSARRRRFPSQELEQVLWPGPALRLAGAAPGAGPGPWPGLATAARAGPRGTHHDSMAPLHDDCRHVTSTGGGPGPGPSDHGRLSPRAGRGRGGSSLAACGPGYH
jgi:hypothetical protein